MINNLTSVFLILSLFLTAGLLVFVFWLNYYFRNYAREYKNLAQLSVQIPENASLTSISELLVENKIIDDAQTFYWYLRLVRRNIRSVPPGIYFFDGKITNEDVADRLQTRSA